MMIKGSQRTYTLRKKINLSEAFVCGVNRKLHGQVDSWCGVNLFQEVHKAAERREVSSLLRAATLISII